MLGEWNFQKICPQEDKSVNEETVAKAEQLIVKAHFSPKDDTRFGPKYPVLAHKILEGEFDEAEAEGLYDTLLDSALTHRNTMPAL
ncbi:MAG: hypothetical protein HC767_04270 [Akkermansiaceae bacterium]|nr:hypothetical protein [Akkermansiaceae bacterium]